jgi:hypothetical protein
MKKIFFVICVFAFNLNLFAQELYPKNFEGTFIPVDFYKKVIETASYSQSIKETKSIKFFDVLCLKNNEFVSDRKFHDRFKLKTEQINFDFITKDEVQYLLDKNTNFEYIKISDSTDYSSAYPVESPDKLMIGGFMGMNIQKTTKDAKEKLFKCPSDSANYTTVKMSYANLILIDDTLGKKRLIVGRDNPGAATWLDLHKGITAANNNHPTTLNVCYLGGHVNGIVIKDSQNAGFGTLNGAKFYDQITY